MTEPPPAVPPAVSVVVAVPSAPVVDVSGATLPGGAPDGVTPHVTSAPAIGVPCRSVTVAVAKMDLGYFNTPIAMVIALAKAALIVLFFMHVRNAPPLVRIFAAGGFLWLGILFVFTFSDVLTRH